MHKITLSPCKQINYVYRVSNLNLNLRTLHFLCHEMAINYTLLIPSLCDLKTIMKQKKIMIKITKRKLFELHSLIWAHKEWNEERRCFNSLKITERKWFFSLLVLETRSKTCSNLLHQKLEEFHQDIST